MLATSTALPEDIAGEAPGEAGSQAGYVKATVSPWYLAEGCTEGGMETWVLV